ncbi:LOW QUALITY PROTEIN: hypothetical protein Cgig2_033683 [Carnegiea gigantea]|uniref:Uncharacterized protein n=1 Tax=Carnegiea gigantea TaxID=171969 RepID=A0A9Q1JU30_9CARY|nr:LOW QUALITY PROTEIN: hypothetical protein Cgig2_033683 [Carnegiea gigantea]
MICLPLCFGDKAKARNLEVDFLVINVPTAYNVILGRLTPHKVKAVIASHLLPLQFEADDGSIGKLQGDQRMARECYLISIQPLVERTFIIIAALMRSSLLAFVTEGRGLTRSLLVAQPIFISYGRVKIHQLRISTLGLGTTTILQYLTYTSNALLTSSPVALILGLSRSLGPSRGFDLRFGAALFPTNTVLYEAFVLGHRLFQLLVLCMKIANLPLQNGIRTVEAVNRLLQAIVTCSSLAEDGFTESDRAKAHDLANFSTKAHLEGRSAAKKSTVEAWVFAEGSPMACRATC